MTDDRLSLREKLAHFNILMILLISCLATIGFVMLFDAANQNLQPWAQPQILRFVIGLCLMIVIALSPVHWWMKYAYAFYILSLIALILVELMGHIGMGAQRWLNLYFFKVQPSEGMRISLILALACYFHRQSLEEIRKIRTLILPLLMIFVPAVLILRQPDLGTAIMLVGSGVLVLFLAGVKMRYFIISACSAIISFPIIWTFLHDYQKNRILTFLDPERDPFGAGYHILQSKIALGSGGVWGKGFSHGTQSHLNFLPEKQTDFIFTMFAEEFGFMGAIVVIGLFAMLIGLGIFLSLRCHSTFTRLVSMGIIGTVFLYVFINMAMVMGLLPVVGVPLPLISYGGTAMLTLLIGFGFFLNMDVHRHVRLKRYY